MATWEVTVTVTMRVKAVDAEEACEEARSMMQAAGFDEENVAVKEEPRMKRRNVRRGLMTE